jgi:hypothetical protein
MTNDASPGYHFEVLNPNHNVCSKIDKLLTDENGRLSNGTALGQIEVWATDPVWAFTGTHADTSK